MQAPRHDPSAIYRYRDSIAAADSLCAAIVDLDLFTLLDREPMTLSALCGRLGIHPRPTDVMLTLFTANQFLDRDAEGRFQATPMAREFLVAGSPFDARAYYRSMAERPGVADWIRVLRTGKPASWPGEEGESDWHAAMRTEAFAESFTAAMDCRGRVLAAALAAALDLRQAGRLLDIGGGSGVYSIGCIEAASQLRATVIEAAPVDAIARRTIAAAGCADRIAVVTADMFADAWPEAHDLHLFSNVLHDWDEPQCRELLAKSVGCLPPGGRIVIHDMLLDDDKAGPLWAAEYSVLLAGVTQGRLYAAREIAGWIGDHGLAITRSCPTALGRGLIEIRRTG
jgi:predicted O-methyltransferase YrrM